jgi:NAD(P)-dependent dehydrogenase (short-subunit alcohol dehydrogenase family)
MEKVLKGRAELHGDTVEVERQRAFNNQAVARFVPASEIADLAIFLAGPSAQSITGQAIAIDGGSKAAE